MNAITTVRAGSGSLAPQTFAEAWDYAQRLARSSMIPRDYVGKPENILVALQWGAEVGLGPMQALNGISVINGRPSIWGDAALALVRGHSACQSVAEGVEGEGEARHGWCVVQRRGEPAQRRQFSVADAKKANLWGKAGPWQQYPDRMLQLRARGFAIRDVFPDALRGVITREEAMDIPPEPREVQSTVVRSQPPAPKALAAEIEPEVAWAVLRPDTGELANVPRRSWERACLKAVSQMEDGHALARWQAGMEEPLASLADHDADAVQRVRDAISDALDRFAEASTPGDYDAPDDAVEPAAEVTP